MIPARFGESAPFSLGAEEELMLLDAESLAPVPSAAAVIDDGSRRTLPGTLKPELFAAVLESNTPVCDGAGELLRVLTTLRRATVDLAGARDALVAAFGMHPFSPSAEQAFSEDERYRPMIRFGGPTTARQNVCGLHVHVGVPDEAACHRALEGVLPWLPLLLALSANSPYLEGTANGLLSNRAETLGLLYRNGAPPAFRSYGEWEAYVARHVATGTIDDYTRLWWDVRPHPRYGTVEVRILDQPTSVRRSAAFAALVQALVATAVHDAGTRFEPARRGDYVENRWRALRFGPRAELIHPDEDRLVPMATLFAELLERVAPAADRLGGAGLLAELGAEACEADEQLAAGDARAAAAGVVELSLASAG